MKKRPWRQWHCGKWVSLALACALFCSLGGPLGARTRARAEEEGALAPSDGLIYHLPFDGSLTNAAGGKLAGASGAARYEEGVVGQAVSNANLFLPDDLFGKTKDYSISTWFKTPAAPDANDKVFSIGDGDVVRYMYFKASNASGLPEFAFTNNGVGGEQRLVAGRSLAPDTWYHALITQRATTSKMYINGVLAALLNETVIYPSEMGITTNNVIQWGGPMDEFKIRSTYTDENAAAEEAVAGLSDADAVALIKGMLDVPATTKQTLALCKIDGDLRVTWASSHPAIISDTGWLTRPEEETNVTLTASITRGTVTDTAVFTTKAATASASDAALNVNVRQKGPAIMDTLFGAFFEDINWGADGGLYPEKFTNRSFEYFVHIWNGTHATATSPHNRTNEQACKTHGWMGVGGATFDVTSDAPYMNENNQNYAKLTVPSPGGGLLNYGYGNITGTAKAGNEVNYPGMSFIKGDVYIFSLYVRGAVKTTATVTLYGGGTNDVAGMYGADTYEVGKATLNINTKGDGWQKVSVPVTVTRDVANSTGLAADGFADIRFENPGVYYLDFISLYPKETFNNRENGLRKDLVEKLKDMTPGSFPFLGGCVSEGTGPDNMYNWKKTVGPIEERQLDFNLWCENNYSGGRNNVYYYQSFGLGYYEYMLLCEDLGMEAMPVLNAGIACELRELATYGTSIYRGGVTPGVVDMEGLQPYITDALDFIAFCNGDPATNEWAALRAEMGHPEPFNLKYLAIGNEQQNGPNGTNLASTSPTEHSHYSKYYHEFQKQIHDAYPEIRLISSSGRSTSGAGYNVAYNWLLRGNAYSPGPKGLDYAWAVDEHGYYSNETTMYNDVNRYNATAANYDRTLNNGDRPYVFFGEYSFRGNSQRNNIRSALVEGALMTGFEKNADIVAMASYAPLFAKDGYQQWNPDAIWSSEYTSYGSAAYYNQKLFANHTGDYYIPNDLTYTTKSVGDTATRPYSSVMYDEEANEIIVRAINPIREPYDLKVTLDGAERVNPVGRVFQLGGAVSADGAPVNDRTNTLTQQRNVYDREFSWNGFAPEFYYTLSPYSSYVFRISLHDDATMVSYAPPMAMTTKTGVVPALPDAFGVVYADGSTGFNAVTWEPKPDSFYDIEGSYKLYGDIAGTGYKATILLDILPEFSFLSIADNAMFQYRDGVRGALTVNLQNNTGALQSGQALLALYDKDDALLFFQGQEVLASLEDTLVTFDDIDAPLAQKGCYGKIFFWDKDTYAPLALPADFSILERTLSLKYPGVNTALTAQPTLSTAKAYYPQHDGEIVYGPDTTGEYWYWDFSTDQGNANVYNGNEIRKSKDLVNWEWVGTAIRVYQDEETGKYFHNYPPGVTLEGFNENTGAYTRRVFGYNGVAQGNNFWAPYVFDNSAQDGYYYMYYSFSQFATRTSDLGVYRCKALDGVWEFCKVLVQTRSAEGPGYNCIDPMVTRDKDGRLWLLYGSFFHGIALVELDANDPTKIIGTTTYNLARRDQYDYTTDDGNNCGLEGATIVYNPEFDYYYLLICYDFLGDLYNTRVARSKTITGPYYDANGNNVNYEDRWDSPTRGYAGTKLVGAYRYNNDNHRGWVGTGHAAFFKAQDGHYYITHNARPGTNTNRPYLNVRRVIWSADGWPMASSEVTAGENPDEMTYVPKEAAAGNWEFIRQERIVTGRTLQQFTSTTYALTADGKIGANGSWTYSLNADGSADATVDLGTGGGNDGLIAGKVYYGWDWENWKETLLFLGKDEDNTIYWGKQVS